MNGATKRLRPELLPIELAPILAHGIGNSIDFTVMYFGLYPGAVT